MPQISVSTVLFYKGDEHLFPVDDELELEGIDKRFKGLRFPSKGRTFLYGHNNPGGNYLLGLGPVVGLEAIKVDASVEIEKWIKHKITFADDEERGLGYSRFLSFARATKDVLEGIDDACRDRSKGTIFGEKGSVAHPEHLDALVDDPRFKHLWVIAYTVDTKEVGRMQVATVFDLEAITEIQGSSILDKVDIYI
jgi:hypothetical protein